MRIQRVPWHGLSLLLLLSIVSPTIAVQPPPAATRHSLWKIQGKRNTVYLMGSIHVLKAENYPLAAPLEAAFTNSQTVAFETDIGAMENPETQMKILAKARLPEGETLAQQLSADTYAKFTKHVEAAGLPPAVFDQFKPAMAVMALEVLEIQKLGLDPEQGLDKHFYALATKQQKTIVPLETLDFQIGLIAEINKLEGEALMKSTLADLDKLKTVIGDMLKAWETGDSEKLEKLLNEAVSEDPAIYKRLLTDRNHRWIPKIEELLAGDKNAVVIVGAGHLVGKEGVVELLRKKGFKVTQL